MIFTFFCNTIVLAVEPSTAGTVGKFSESLSTKLAETPKNEKVSAYVFLEDKSESVLTTMKTSYAELFTTYAAAKGITVATAEHKSASATDTQRIAAVDDTKLQETIEVKRQLYRDHYSARNAAVLGKYYADEDVLYVSAYAPMAIVSGTAKELKELALDSSVTRMDLFVNQKSTVPIETDISSQTRNTAYIEEHIQ